jgi:hypothetical protein
MRRAGRPVRLQNSRKARLGGIPAQDPAVMRHAAGNCAGRGGRCQGGTRRAWDEVATALAVYQITDYNPEQWLQSELYTALLVRLADER